MENFRTNFSDLPAMPDSESSINSHAASRCSFPSSPSPSQSLPTSSNVSPVRKTGRKDELAAQAIILAVEEAMFRRKQDEQGWSQERWIQERNEWREERQEKLTGGR